MSEVTVIVHLNNIELFFKYSIILFCFNASVIERCNLNVEIINFFFHVLWELQFNSSRVKCRVTEQHPFEMHRFCRPINFLQISLDLGQSIVLTNNFIITTWMSSLCKAPVFSFIATLVLAVVMRSSRFNLRAPRLCLHYLICLTVEFQLPASRFHCLWNADGTFRAAFMAGIMRDKLHENLFLSG